MTKCMWCENEAVNLCDAPIALKAVGAIRGVDFDLLGLSIGSDENGDLVMYTCDAPLCIDHTKVIGFICGKDPETIDRCPYHHEQDKKEKAAPAILENEIDGLRRLEYSKIRRSIIKKESMRIK